MPESKLNRAGSWADSIYKIVGLLILLGTAIFSCCAAWMQIWNNELDIDTLQAKMKKEFKLRDERSAKRYKRAEEWRFELQNEGRMLMKELDVLENQLEYIKGKEGY